MQTFFGVKGGRDGSSESEGSPYQIVPIGYLFQVPGTLITESGIGKTPAGVEYFYDFWQAKGRRVCIAGLPGTHPLLIIQAELN